jgi:hypothetical protein
METGSIVDFYDDPQGTVLKEKVAAAQLPDYIKTAHFLTDAAKEIVPDDCFALVMIDGTEKLRKYACVDKGNTALSVIYFMENHDKLTKEAQQVAAQNLINACDVWDLRVPYQLEQLAGQEKTAGVYVDVTGKSAPPQFEQQQHERYCLVKEGSARFPIDSYGQVQQAVEWFEKYAESLHPADRREYCVKLAQRAEELNLQINDKIKKYGGQGYAPNGEVQVAVCTRMQHWADGSQEKGMLQGLMDKYASVPSPVRRIHGDEPSLG